MDFINLLLISALVGLFVLIGWFAITWRLAKEDDFDARRREVLEEQMQVLDKQMRNAPARFTYAERPRADDLATLGLKESDFSPPPR